MSYVASDVIEETIRLLLSGQREPMNKLLTDVSSGATSLALKYELGAMQADSLLAIDTEIYRVWEINKDTRTVTVEPAMQGSTTTAHTAGSLVYVNPRITRFAAFKALNDEISSLSSPALGLFAVKTLEFTYEGAQTDYDITASTEILDVLDVRIEWPGPEQHWQALKDWRLRRKADTTDFASGNALFVPNGVPGRTVRVTYSAPYTRLTALTDDIESVGGIPPAAQDILAMGTLLRIGSVREIKRNFTEAQGDSRRAGEVPATAVGNSFSYLRQMRDNRIAQEAARLMREYPPRRRI
jgi:hypothetical protein